MKISIKHVLYALVLPTIWVAACSSDDTTAPAAPAGVDELRQSLAPYASLTLAKAAGYSTAITDCMSNGD